jgi:UDP-2-acetamido-2-deoxy-ribo-hexuluronate aminotransferase
MTASGIRFVDLGLQYRLLKDSIDARIQRVLDHGQYVMGPEVGEMEAALAGHAGTGHCISCGSGTEALLMSLMALGIGPGDEVVTTPFTFVATAEAIVLAGATPVFVDIQPDTLNLDPDRLEAALTARTRAILPVSLYGQPADMEPINAVAERHGLAVIEDAAQSLGARYRGRMSGNLSRLACTSFFPSKPLGCYGDGGAVFTRDDDLAGRLREIRDHGQSGRYHHVRIGLNGRMDTLQCAVVLAKLERFGAEIECRGEVAGRYCDLLDGLPGLVLPTLRPDRTSAWAQFTVQVAGRDALAAGLKAAGIPTAVHYPVPLHRQPAYADRVRAAGPLAVAERAAERVISLPMHPYLDRATQARIRDAIATALAPA